ncbi:MAG: hypothetical protein WKF56_01950 [Candidatus Limnocylindrales bacterium]
MARRGVPIDRQHDLAVQAARRMIARGERPMYRLQSVQDGRWAVDGLPGVSVAAASRRAVLDTMRAAIAETLDVPADTFDLGT